MTKPATKRATTARKRRQSSATPVNSRSKTRQVDPDDDDDDEDEELATDEAIALFFRKPPSNADHVLVVAAAHGGDAIIQDRAAAEVRRAPVQLANAVLQACDRYAYAEGREVKFRASWQVGERVIATHQWKCGEGDPQALDGTVESFLAQQQRHAEVSHRLYHDGYSMVQEGWRTLLTAANKRIESLESDNASLRDKLRRVDDVSSEIALEQARMEMEQRGRTADILENRVLPIAQAMLIKQAESQLAATAAAVSKQENAAAKQ